MHVDDLGIARPSLRMGGGFEVVTETVRGQAQVKTRLAVALDRRRGGKRGRQGQTNPGGRGESPNRFQEITLVQIHQGNSTAKPKRLQSKSVHQVCFGRTECGIFTPVLLRNSKQKGLKLAYVIFDSSPARCYLYRHEI